MNLVFVNSFEKRVEEDRIITAQVSIAERQGVWHVLWTEPDQEGRGTQSAWFEGDKWQDMLAVFRTKLAEKAAEGFLPLIEGQLDETDGSSGKGVFTRMLHYYSEGHANEEMFQQLRKWRREQAVLEGKPSYIVATDRVLRMIACFVPQSEQELLYIPGFGEHKASLYGKAIIDITGNYPRSGTFPLDWVAERIEEYPFKLWQHKQKELKIKAGLERKAAKKKLLELALGGESLDAMQQSLGIARRELLLWIEELESEGYDFDAWIDAELQSMPGVDRDLAWKAMQEEGDRYLKPVLKKMYSEEELKDKDVDRIYEWLRLMRLQHRKEKRAGSAAKAG